MPQLLAHYHTLLDLGTYKTVKARFRPWLEPFSDESPQVVPSLHQVGDVPQLLEHYHTLLAAVLGTYETVKARFWPWLELFQSKVFKTLQVFSIL